MNRNLGRAAHDLALAERLIQKTHTGYQDMDAELRAIAARIRRLETSLRSGLEDSPTDRPVIFDSGGYPR